MQPFLIRNEEHDLIYPYCGYFSLILARDPPIPTVLHATVPRVTVATRQRNFSPAAESRRAGPRSKPPGRVHGQNDWKALAILPRNAWRFLSVEWSMS